jgi:hypothetical protein
VIGQRLVEVFVDIDGSDDLPQTFLDAVYQSWVTHHRRVRFFTGTEPRLVAVTTGFSSGRSVCCNMPVSRTPFVASRGPIGVKIGIRSRCPWHWPRRASGRITPVDVADSTSLTSPDSALSVDP